MHLRAATSWLLHNQLGLQLTVPPLEGASVPLYQVSVGGLRKTVCASADCVSWAEFEVELEQACPGAVGDVMLGPVRVGVVGAAAPTSRPPCFQNAAQWMMAAAVAGGDAPHGSAAVHALLTASIDLEGDLEPEVAMEIAVDVSARADVAEFGRAVLGALQELAPRATAVQASIAANTEKAITLTRLSTDKPWAVDAPGFTGSLWAWLSPAAKPTAPVAPAATLAAMAEPPPLLRLTQVIPSALL